MNENATIVEISAKCGIYTYIVFQSTSRNIKSYQINLQQKEDIELGQKLSYII